jgi:hypothetical protein
MGKVLEFMTREQRDPFVVLKTRTLDTVRELVDYYKSTGKWDPASCDEHVIHAIDELQVVCAIVAGKITITGVSDEQPPSVG